MLEPGQAVQTKVEDGLRLRWGEMVLLVNQTILFGELIGATGISSSALQHGHHVTRRPGCRHQALARIGRRGRGLYQLDDRVNVGQGNCEPLQNMATFPRLAQQINGSTGDNLAPMPDKGVNHLLEVEHLRLAINQRNHVDADYRLQLGLGIKVIQNHVADFATTQLNHHPQPVLVGLVT